MREGLAGLKHRGRLGRAIPDRPVRIEEIRVPVQRTEFALERPVDLMPAFHRYKTWLRLGRHRVLIVVLIAVPDTGQRKSGSLHVDLGKQWLEQNEAVAREHRKRVGFPLLDFNAEPLGDLAESLEVTTNLSRDRVEVVHQASLRR